jgi:hypothetical protein
VTSIRVQNPGVIEVNLLDTLVGLADGASGGGAFFAFASADGVRLLLGDDAFVGAMRRGRFDLVVGMDAITDTAALAALEAIATEQQGLGVAAFLHKRSALFHPKLCWLLKGRSVELVVGSGNLTPGGLRKNWEAFAHLRLEGEEARSFLGDIDRWRTDHAAWLRQIDDPSVVERARRNALGRAAVRRVSRQAEEGLEELAPEPQPIDAEVSDVLVAEIPRASTRWNQANFDLHSFETFFGARAGAHTRIVLRHVTTLGELGTMRVGPEYRSKATTIASSWPPPRDSRIPARAAQSASFSRPQGGLSSIGSSCRRISRPMRPWIRS